MGILNFFEFIVVLAVILGVSYFVYYNAFQRCFIKINEVEGKIDVTLRERFDLLCKAADFIKETIKKDVLKELSNLEDYNLSSFELERKLVSLTREFCHLRITNRELIKLDSFTNIDFALKENEAELDGYTEYYNDNITKLNKLVKMFPSNIVAMICHFKEKDFYDGKNMNDDINNDFKL